MAVVLDNQIPRIPDAIGILGGAGGVLRDPAVASHRGMNNPVLERDLAIVDGQRLEQLGLFAGVLNSHVVGIRVMALSTMQRGEESS